MFEEIKYLEYPRISVFRNVLTSEECRNIIKKYENAMNPNAGLESREQTYGQITEEVEQRSISEQTEDADRQFFKNKIVEMIGVPVSHIEAGDIYRYDTNQYFGLHHDFPYDPRTIPYYKHGGDRKATAIFWLNEGYEGGRCTWPELGVTVEPELGGVMYFEYDYPDEAVNMSTIHESLPVTKGIKWIAAFFLANGPRVDEH
jgi:hypothetical protein